MTLQRFNLRAKFTIMLVLVFLGGIVLSAAVLIQALQRRAEGEVTSKGLLLLQTMNAVRYYTSTHVNPLLAPQLETETEFISESVPAFSAREVFERLRTDTTYQDFYYKEATLNPTNPRNRADDFEIELIARFKTDPATTELSGFRTLFDQRVFYNARPIKISNESCLQCHGALADAPASLVTTYGGQGGFGWALDEIVGAQIIYVPAADVSEIAGSSFILVMAVFLVVFSLSVLLLNRLLNRNVVQPVGLLAALSNKIARGEAEENDANALNPLARQTDELGQLARVFRRMALEVYAREQRLRQQLQELRIEIDESRRERQVAEVVETEYFQQLQEKARAFRASKQKQGALAAEDRSREPEG
jgi:hypothetical protein